MKLHSLDGIDIKRFTYSSHFPRCLSCDVCKHNTQTISIRIREKKEHTEKEKKGKANSVKRSLNEKFIFLCSKLSFFLHITARKKRMMRSKEKKERNVKVIYFLFSLLLYLFRQPAVYFLVTVVSYSRQQIWEIKGHFFFSFKYCGLLLAFEWHGDKCFRVELACFVEDLKGDFFFVSK